MKKNILRQLLMLSKRLIYVFLMQLFLATVLTAHPGNAQRKTIEEVKVSLNLKEKTLLQFFKQVEAKTSFKFTFNNDRVDLKQRVTVVDNNTVYKVLEFVSLQTQLNFVQVNENIHVKSESHLDNKQAVKIIQTVDVTVSGTVTDANGEPIPGVTVAVPGKTIGTATDLNGRYSLTVPEGATLVFSFIGFETRRVEIGDRGVIDVVLREDMTSLDEVVVIGYGSLNRRELTSAVVSVKPEEMNMDAGTGTDLLRVLQGKVAGLSITRPNAGNPNQDFEIRLRGTTSISAGQSPLIVVDGVPGGNLSTLNPHDIKSIDILKDASAAAIYGTRGTNGVIVIQTKSGETTDGVNVTISSQWFTESVAKQTEMLSRDQYLQLKEELQETRPEVSAAMIDYGFDTDWFDEIQRDNTLNYQQHLAILGKGENSSYRLSGSYYKHDGLFIETGRKDYKVNLNVTQYALNKMLTLQAQMGIRESNAKPMSTFPYMMAMRYNPTQPVHVDGDPTKEYYQQYGVYQYQNPVAELKLPTQANRSGSYFSRLHTQLNPIEALTISTLFSYETSRGMNGNYVPSTAYGEINVNRYGTASKSSSQSINRLFEATVDWDEIFGSHKINVVTGYSYQDFDNESMSATNYNFISDNTSYHNLGAGSYLGEGRAAMNSSKSESRLVGFFARSMYSWDNRFFLSASVRREGSSKFGSENQWGTFPAASAAWTISNEQFARNITWLDFMKVRFGYGKTGNQGIGNYIPLIRLSTSGYFFYNGQFIQGYAPVSNANPFLKWETKHEFDIGIDWVILNGRLGGAIDLYSRKTLDLLHDYDVPVPPNLYPSTFANVASMNNRGIELTVNVVPVKKENLQWNVDVTFDHRTQKILSLSSGQYKLEYRDIGANFFPGSALTHAYTHRYAEGTDVGNFYGYKFEGFDEEGQWIFADLNNDGVINFDDNAVIGNGLPDFYANLNTSLTYKNWNVSAMLRGQFGHEILNTKRLLYGNMKSLPRTILADYDKELYDTQEYSDYYLEKGDWVKLDNFTVGYNFPLENLDMIRNLRIYFTGSNLLTFTKTEVQEPELSISGLTPGVSQVRDYPSARTYLMGVELSF